MQEYIEALHAIWDAWEGGGRLDFRGDFYQHTYTVPLFCPAPLEYGRPKVYLAAVGPLMTRTAGRVADGLVCHSFTTADYLREVTMPALRAGEAAAGRPPGSTEISLGIMTVAARTPAEFERQALAARLQIAFYGSTPAYRGVLEHHGWGEAQTELRDLSLQGRWKDMAAVIDDEMLHTIAAVGSPGEVADIVATRYGEFADRFTVLTLGGATPLGAEIDHEAETRLLGCLREAAGLDRSPGA